MSNALKVIQFTDTHLYKDSSSRMRGVDTYDTFKQVVDHALAKEGTPDLLLLTGDISMDETAESYDRVREIVEPIGAPIYFLPGNHDCFDTLWLRFIEHKQSSNIKPDRSFVRDNWLIVMLDSVVPLKVEGRLSDTELERLDAELSAHANLNALVCLHHNVVPIALNPDEDQGLKNADSLFGILDKHANVRGVLWGHVHGEYSIRRHDVDLMASPSTCIQFRVTPEGIAIDTQPPGYRLLLLGSDGSIRTRVERVATLPAGLQVGTLD